MTPLEHCLRFSLMFSNVIFSKKMAKALCHLNVPVTVVLDAAVG